MRASKATSSEATNSGRRSVGNAKQPNAQTRESLSNLLIPIHGTHDSESVYAMQFRRYGKNPCMTSKSLSSILIPLTRITFHLCVCVCVNFTIAILFVRFVINRLCIEMIELGVACKIDFVVDCYYCLFDQKRVIYFEIYLYCVTGSKLGTIRSRCNIARKHGTKTERRTRMK